MRVCAWIHECACVCMHAFVPVALISEYKHDVMTVYINTEVVIHYYYSHFYIAVLNDGDADFSA